MQTTSLADSSGRGKKGATGGVANKDQLPDEFIKVSRHRSTLSFTTFDLMRLNGWLILKSVLDHNYIDCNTHNFKLYPECISQNITMYTRYIP